MNPVLMADGSPVVRGDLLSFRTLDGDFVVGVVYDFAFAPDWVRENIASPDKVARSLEWLPPYAYNPSTLLPVVRLFNGRQTVVDPKLFTRNVPPPPA